MKKNISISVKPLNKALNRAIKERDLSNEDVVRELGIYTAAAIGNYRSGKRKVPTDLVAKWKEKYGEDLMALAETYVSTIDTNVLNQTKKAPLDEHTYSMPRDAWEVIKRQSNEMSLTTEHQRKELDILLALVTQYANKDALPNKG